MQYPGGQWTARVCGFEQNDQTMSGRMTLCMTEHMMPRYHRNRDDLMQASRDAVGGMIDWICATTQMPEVDAYMLCSVAGDLRISEIVDVPNWVVSFYFPKSVLG